MNGFGEAAKGGGVTGDRLEELLMACIEAVGVDGGGMSLASGTGSGEPMFGSDDTARAMERLQFTLGEGPCVDASVSGSPVLVADLVDPEDGVANRWPVFLTEAAQAGVRAVFAFPIRIGAISLGAVDLYRRTPGPLTGGNLTRVLSVVDAMALTLLDLDGSLDAEVDLEKMHNLVVHRAAGMMMVQMSSSIEQALMRLRATAYSEGIPIDELANSVVLRKRRFQEEEE